jgi:hypothetical protein
MDGVSNSWFRMATFRFKPRNFQQKISHARCEICYVKTLSYFDFFLSHEYIFSFFLQTLYFREIINPWRCVAHVAWNVNVRWLTLTAMQRRDFTHILFSQQRMQTRTCTASQVPTTKPILKKKKKPTTKSTLWSQIQHSYVQPISRR